ncbi:MAG: hypothetical protein WCF10_18880 [Polyangiales bacterium]
MTETFLTTLRSCTTLVATCATIPLTGCLYEGDPGHIAGNSGATVSLDGVQVELIHHSTTCKSTNSEGLVVEVGPDVEYPADVVRELEASCALAPHPGVEVHIEDQAVIFDFSNIEEPGRFPDAEFEGYILHIVHTEDAPLLVAAVVDWETTTMDVGEDALSYDVDQVAINLAGRPFDSNSFVKVDLFLGRL